jgi:hypothetical protein
MSAAVCALAPPQRVEDARERAYGGERAQDLNHDLVRVRGARQAAPHPNPLPVNGERERTERAVNLREAGPEGAP